MPSLTTREGPQNQPTPACEKWVHLMSQTGSWDDPTDLPSGRAVFLPQYADEWATPVAAIVLVLSALPWRWYFILRRICELREAIR